MKKRTLGFFCAAAFVLIAAATASQAYTMADYWCFQEGNVWIYDRDVHVMGGERHAFTGFTGTQFLQARDFCSNNAFIYTGPEGVLGVGIYSRESNLWIDLSATPIKLADAEMNIGDKVSTSIPAGILDPDALSFEMTLEAAEAVTVPEGTFNDSLRMKIFVDDGLGTYTERVWLARGVGMVKMFRVSETNNTPGCFMTCGSMNCQGDAVEERSILLRQFLKGKRGVVVIPLE